MGTTAADAMKATHAYIGRRPLCGCVAAAVVDVPGNESETAEDVAEFIKEGMRIEHVTVQYVRENFAKDCEKCRKPIEQNLFS